MRSANAKSPLTFSPFFFTAIATSNVEDIRSVLDFYRQEDDIIEAFKRNQARLREAEEARSPQQTARSSWTGMFGRGFSFGRPSNKSVSRNNFVWFVVKKDYVTAEEAP